MKILYLVWILIVVTSCNKIGNDDPNISFRSRTKRISGIWQITRYYYYDGHKSGLNNNGDPKTYFLKILPNGDVHGLDSNLHDYGAYMQWSWIAANGEYKEFERILIYRKDINFSDEHILEELRMKKIRSRIYFDYSDLKRYFICEWKRID